MSSRKRKGVANIKPSGTAEEEDRKRMKKRVGGDRDKTPIMKIPEKIIDAKDSNGQTVFFMKWKGVDEHDLIPAEEAKLKWPQFVIKFYEGRIKWISSPET
eukprot:XP_016658868.1 PREDICTED: chromobox protein homolog 3-like [Acyrthosiphon pisum]